MASTTLTCIPFIMSVVSKSLGGAMAFAILGASAVPVLAGSFKLAQADTMMAPKSVITKQSFRKAEAPVSGSFMIKKEAGKQILVLSSDFKTNDMAPDLKVVFSPSATPLANTKAPGYPLKAGSYTILASLKSASGAQSYVIPASIDLSRYRSVLIWCKKFNATMAWAPLKP